MPLSNRTTVNRWLSGRRGTAHNIRSDGKSLWSYSLEIGRTKKGRKEILNYTRSSGITTSSSTSSHISLLILMYEIEINEALESAGIKCCSFDCRCWGPPSDIGDNIRLIIMHDNEYDVNDERLYYILNVNYPEFKKIINSGPVIVDPRSNRKEHLSLLRDNWYIYLMTTTNDYVAKAWLSGYGLKSNNLRTDGLNIYSCQRLIGKTKRNKTKVLYDYTAKSGNFKNRKVSVGVRVVQRIAALEKKEIEVITPKCRYRLKR